MNPTDPTEHFADWAVRRLGLNVTPAESGVLVLSVPEAERNTFEGAGEVRFTFDRERYEQSTAAAPVELITPGGRLLGWLIDQVRILGNVTHAAPQQPAITTRELAERLLPAYTVDGGRVHLAGCALESRAVMRVTFRLRLEGLEPHDELLEVFATSDEQIVAPEVAAELQLEQLAPIAPTPKVGRFELERLMRQATSVAEDRRKLAETNLAESLLPKKLAEVRQLEDYFAKTKAETQTQYLGESADKVLAKEERAALDEQLAALEEQKKRRLAAIEERYSVQGKLESVAAVLIWCQFALGKLRFSINDSTADVPFATWAGILQPPPFVCHYTGRPTFHVATTDDGRIAAFEEIAVCEVSHRRVLKRELVRCVATGKTVLKEMTERCPVTGQPVIKDRFKTCGLCHVHVSPHILRGEECRFCPPAANITKNDPRLVRALSEYPGLDEWRNWKLSETPAAYVFTAAGLWKQLLVVLDKRSLEPLRLAGKSRLGTQWNDVPTAGYEEVLR